MSMLPENKGWIQGRFCSWNDCFFHFEDVGTKGMQQDRSLIVLLFKNRKLPNR